MQQDKNRPLSTPFEAHLNSMHFRNLNTMLKKGYASQVLFCSNVPPAIRIPALLACRMYEEVMIEVLNTEEQLSLYNLWLVAACYAIGSAHEEYYQQLD